MSLTIELFPPPLGPTRATTCKQLKFAVHLVFLHQFQTQHLQDQMGFLLALAVTSGSMSGSGEELASPGFTVKLRLLSITESGRAGYENVTASRVKFPVKEGGLRLAVGSMPG